MCLRGKNKVVHVPSCVAAKIKKHENRKYNNIWRFKKFRLQI